MHGMKPSMPMVPTAWVCALHMPSTRLPTFFFALSPAATTVP